jgi:hypothetical protein
MYVLDLFSSQLQANGDQFPVSMMEDVSVHDSAATLVVNMQSPHQGSIASHQDQYSSSTYMLKDTAEIRELQSIDRECSRSLA